MNSSSILLQPAFILQNRKYRDTSLILDVLTRDHGIQSLLVKGVRQKKSKTAGILLAFNLLSVSYTGNRELKLLTHVDLLDDSVRLKGLGLYCGFYINELVGLFLQKEDANTEIFLAYLDCLHQLNVAENIENHLRQFEVKLLNHIGYAVAINNQPPGFSQIDGAKYYDFSELNGVHENIQGVVSGSTLNKLLAEELLDSQGLKEAKQLLRKIIDFYLDGKELKSRRVLAEMLKKLN